MNSRKKGQRTELKARRWAEGQGALYLAWHQAPRWATEQPFDGLVLKATQWPVCVEVRSNAWRTGDPATVQLSRLPGEGYHKQIWRFQDGTDTPDIREWRGDTWQPVATIWEVLI